MTRIRPQTAVPWKAVASGWMFALFFGVAADVPAQSPPPKKPSAPKDAAKGKSEGAETTVAAPEDLVVDPGSRRLLRFGTGEGLRGRPRRPILGTRYSTREIASVAVTQLKSEPEPAPTPARHPAPPPRLGPRRRTEVRVPTPP